MPIIPIVSTVFFVISVIFLVVSIRDYMKHGSTMTIARRIWLRMALIFAVVGSGLYLMHHMYSG